jgi:hypothetical protein
VGGPVFLYAESGGSTRRLGAPTMNSKPLCLSLLLVTACAGAPTPPAGWTFQAVSRSESEGFDLARLSNASVRGWVEGGRGRVEFLGGPGDAVGEGSVLITEDGGATVRLFDSVRKTCLPWSGTFAAAGGPSPASAASLEKFDVKKVLEEPGPEIAGWATRHYRFEISWEGSAGVGRAEQNWYWETVEDLWAAPDLTEPGLALWLNTQTRSTGSPPADENVAGVLAGVQGTPLRRVTVLNLKTGERKLQTTVTLEVTELARQTPPAGTFDLPMACRAEGEGVIP